MPLITPEYQALNAELHERRPDYGTNGKKWAPWIAEHCAMHGFTTVLDYGCGKGSLREALPNLDVREYDPAVEGKQRAPAPAELVVCTDVLEHVEPECLVDVLAHLASLAQRSLLLSISCRESNKRLADGRPAHILVRTPSWWRDTLRPLGDFKRLQGDDYNVVMVR